MSKKTSPKKPAAKKVSAPKAAAKLVKTPKAKAKAVATDTKADECPKGGKHLWKEEDGQKFCEQCFEPAAGKKGKKKPPTPVAAAEANLADRIIDGIQTNDAPAGDATPVATVAKPKQAKVKAQADDAGPKKLSALDAAAKVLGESKEPLTTKEMIEAMATKGYWTSPGGKTPHATLFSALLREINTKGNDARFVKSERGKFTTKA